MVLVEEDEVKVCVSQASLPGARAVALPSPLFSARAP